MAHRIDELLVRGEIDNTEEGKTTGWLWLLGRTEPITLDLIGDCWRDLAGSRLKFRNPDPKPGSCNELSPIQRGLVGDMTASRKVKVPVCSADEFAARCAAGEEVPLVWKNTLYLEWFSETNGRVMIEAADFDLDGDLDVYACVYGAGDDVAGKRGFEAMSPLPFDDAENGGRNVLLANLGGFRFADVTKASGLDAVNSRWSLAAAWEDFDLDGDADLYVANDFTAPDRLYRNDGLDFLGVPTFTDVIADYLPAVTWSSMGSDVADVNNDGLPDLMAVDMSASSHFKA